MVNVSWKMKAFQKKTDLKERRDTTKRRVASKDYFTWKEQQKESSGLWDSNISYQEPESNVHTEEHTDLPEREKKRINLRAFCKSSQVLGYTWASMTYTGTLISEWHRANQNPWPAQIILTQKDAMLAKLDS